MLNYRKFISKIKSFATATLNSYGMLFFSKDRFFSILILAVTFFIPQTGLSGLLAVLIAISGAYLLGFDQSLIKNGLLGYSALLFGLGFATNYETGTAFYLLLLLGSLLCLLLSQSISSKLNSKGLPGLSVSFILTTWIVILAARQFSAIGLTQRHIYWVNETYSIGGEYLVNLIQSIENWKIAPYVSGFFRSMSAIIFQGNIAAGIILSIGLIFYSRISFVLMVYGYAVAIIFNHLMGGFQNGNLSYYNMGTNFMLVAVALGGFYIIASLRSFLWILATVPIAFLLVTGLGSAFYIFGLPVFSLPFCIVVILFLYCLQLRKNPKRLMLTPIQYYSPEANLYRYINGRERLISNQYIHLSLPFLGEWMVSQGYDGNITHKGEWSKALDFVILDGEMKTYKNPGRQCEDFYCYGKPVLSPADGIVEEITDNVVDNEIGQNNTLQNWGNTIIIKHANGLYSKLSHLKMNSIKCAKGSYVKKGEILALCGNSGRSPEPHLHFQVQSTPYIGSKTLAYPVSYFNQKKDTDSSIMHFTTPVEGTFVSNITINHALQEAFNFQTGFTMIASSDNNQKETWEIVTNIYNESYFYCSESNAYAYFINNGSSFYFTNYYGPKQSLLYYLYLSAYKVLFSSQNNYNISDNYPINIFGNTALKWLQDFTAPFFIFLQMNYSSKISGNENLLSNDNITITSEQRKKTFLFEKHISSSEVIIINNRIQSFTYKTDNKNITIQCKEEN